MSEMPGPGQPCPASSSPVWAHLCQQCFRLELQIKKPLQLSFLVMQDHFKLHSGIVILNVDGFQNDLKVLLSEIIAKKLWVPHN